MNLRDFLAKLKWAKPVSKKDFPNLDEAQETLKGEVRDGFFTLSLLSQELH